MRRVRALSGVDDGAMRRTTVLATALALSLTGCSDPEPEAVDEPTAAVSTAVDDGTEPGTRLGHGEAATVVWQPTRDVDGELDAERRRGRRAAAVGLRRVDPRRDDRHRAALLRDGERRQHRRVRPRRAGRPALPARHRGHARRSVDPRRRLQPPARAARCPSRSSPGTRPGCAWSTSSPTAGGCATSSSSRPRATTRSRGPARSGSRAGSRPAGARTRLIRSSPAPLATMGA